MRTDQKTAGTGTLISDVLAHVSNLFRKEVDLAKAEVSANVRRAGIAVGLLAVAGILALVGLNVLAGAAVAALAATGLSAGWSAVIIGGVVFAIALLMALKGINDLSPSALAPDRTIKNVRRDAAVVKEAI